MSSSEFQKVIDRYLDFEGDARDLKDFLGALETKFTPDMATELVTGMANLLHESQHSTRESVIRLGYLITCVAAKLPE